MPDRVSRLLDNDISAAADGSDIVGAALRRFEAIGQYLCSAAHDEPLVVVMDDLHWTDRTSLQLLVYLAEFLATSQVLLVASYRPQEQSPALTDALAALSRCGAERIEPARPTATTLSPPCGSGRTDPTRPDQRLHQGRPRAGPPQPAGEATVQAADETGWSCR
jgi:hypothetical protein